MISTLTRRDVYLNCKQKAIFLKGSKYMKNKQFMAGILAVLMAICAAGCSAEKGSESGNSQTSSVNQQAKNDEQSSSVSTDGSTSMESVIGFLSEAYQEKTGVKVTYNPTGSGSGIQAVQDGRCDIGLSSRDLKPEESQTLNGTVIALDGIAVIVNKDNAVTDLTKEQITKIYLGEIKNWSEVGGSDAPIVCIGREAASGTRDGFESVTGTAEKCVYSQELTSTGDVIQTVASNPNAIGYASLAAVGNTVKALSVDGVTPSEDTVLSKEYPIQRGFLLVTSKDKALSASAQAFFDFCTSSEVSEYIREAGAVPVAE